MNYQQDVWKPRPGSYETTPEGWTLFKDENATDIQSLKKLYPELASWDDIECINAWAGYCSDCNFTEWTEPSRSEQFLVYLRLAQEGNLPDCSKDQEAIYQVIMNS